jgi:Putative peptidoglycan binding domain
MKRRGFLILVVVAGLATAGWLTADHSGSSSSAVPALAPTALARVIRTDIVTRQQIPGVVGFQSSYTLVSELGGIVTHLPVPGQVIRRGQPLFAVDDQPVPLLFGLVPAWRDFGLGMTRGSDVAELNANLRHLGPSGLVGSGNDTLFTWATAAAISQWQGTLGLPQTGQLTLGQVAVLPGPVRVDSVLVTTGAPLTPGTAVLALTSTTPVVQASLDAGSRSLVHPGDRVLVTGPDGTTTTTGIISAVGQPSQTMGSSASGGTAAAGTAAPGAPPPTTIPVTVTLDHPRDLTGLDQAPVQVAITTAEHDGVLAVPITALLAGPGGGYYVQAGAGHRTHRIRVTLGLFDDTAGLVEVTAPGLTRGTLVEVPAE